LNLSSECRSDWSGVLERVARGASEWNEAATEKRKGSHEIESS
jgi:hypothetical protein